MAAPREGLFAGLAEFLPLGKITEEHVDKLFSINKGNPVHGAESPSAIERWCLDHSHGVRCEHQGYARLLGMRRDQGGNTQFRTRMDLELKDRRIRSNVLSPGPTDTSQVSRAPAEAIARIVSTIPIGRIGQSEEIAKAALFLASDDSSFVTGIELFVDGGRGQI